MLDKRKKRTKISKTSKNTKDTSKAKLNTKIETATGNDKGNKYEEELDLNFGLYK